MSDISTFHVVLLNMQTQSALQDPRMIDVLGALMGIDVQASTRPEGSNDIPEGVEVSPQSSPSSSPSKSTPAKPAQPTPPEDVEMEDDDEEAQAKKAAEAAKEAGSLAYKNRDLDEAIKQFDFAWNTWPKNLAYLTNLGGQNNYFLCYHGDDLLF